MKLFIILILISQSSIAINLDISAASLAKTPYLSEFYFKNTSKLDFYCRNIRFSNINYFEKGEYVYTLETQLNDIMINKEQISTFVEKTSQELLDIVDIYPELQSDHENMSVIHNCEPLNSRLNNIYIYDDLTSCGDNRKVIKRFILDNGNEKLLQNGEVDNFLSEKAKVFNLESTGIRFVHDQNAYYLLLDKLKNISVELNGDIFINAFGINRDTFIISSFNSNGLKFTKFVKDEDMFKQSDSLQTDLGKINIHFDIPTDGKYYTNLEEAKLKLMSQLPAVANSFSTYLKIQSGYTNVSIVLSFKTLGWDITPSRISNNNKGFLGFEIRPRNILESYGANIFKLDLEIKDDLKILETSELEYDEMNSLLSNDIFLPIVKAKRILNYKQYQISTREDNVVLRSGAGINKIEGLCRPKWIFSDQVTDLESANVNDRFRGNTLLNMAIKNRDYKKVLKLISEGASVTKGDILGRTPLYYAVNTYQFEFVKLLVENGAKISDNNTINLITLFDIFFYDLSLVGSSEFEKNYELYSYLVNQLFVTEKYKPMVKLKTDLVERFNRDLKFNSLLQIINGGQNE